MSKKLCKDNCLSTLHSEISKEWHPIKNGNITPNDISSKSKKIFWWMCSKGHEWQSTVYSRIFKKDNCPYCLSTLGFDNSKLRYKVVENVVKESLTDNVIDKYYTIVYLAKKYDFFGPLIFREYEEINYFDDHIDVLKKFYDYNYALKKCNSLNNEYYKLSIKECIKTNNSYKIEKITLKNKVTGEIIKEYYCIYWKFLFCWVPWVKYDNYDQAMLNYFRYINGISDKCVISKFT